jgi:pyruvate,orthophosphate dikinase
VKRLVYFFGNGKADGTREMKSVLGGKGANLAEMTNLGVPVPAGFTIACEVCISYLR